MQDSRGAAATELKSGSLTIGDLLPGDILLYRSDGGIISEKISAVTGSPYSHAAIYLGNEEIAESDKWPGVRKSSIWNGFKGTDYIGVLRTQTGFGQDRVRQLQEFVDLLIKNGAEYDLIGALKLPEEREKALAAQLDLLRRDYGKYKEADEFARSAYFCSGLVVACYSVVGIIGTTAQLVYQPQTHSPGDLHRDVTFGWVLGYLVPIGHKVPENDPLRLGTQWADLMDSKWW